jgi:hypothetical protein
MDSDDGGAYSSDDEDLIDADPAAVFQHSGIALSRKAAMEEKTKKQLKPLPSLCVIMMARTHCMLSSRESSLDAN